MYLSSPCPHMAWWIWIFRVLLSCSNHLSDSSEEVLKGKKAVSYAVCGALTISFGESIIALHSAHVFACRCKLQTCVKRALQWIHEYFLPSFSIFLIRNACPSQIPILIMFRKTLDGLRLRYQITSPPSSRSGSKTLIPNQSAKTFPWVRYLSTTSNSPSDVFGKSFGAV